jgi:hypothetical protein
MQSGSASLATLAEANNKKNVRIPIILMWLPF